MSSNLCLVAYTAEGDPGGSQIHVMWVDTKDSTQITHLIESPSGIKWSPDGKQIMFTMRVDAKEGFPITLPKKPKGAQWAPEPRVVTRLNYRRDGSGFSRLLDELRDECRLYTELYRELAAARLRF